MNLDKVLLQFAESQIEYLLIGGMAFFLRHQPCATFDMDFWINDTSENRSRCEEALKALNASWGRTDKDWEPVAKKNPGWLELQGVYCLTSPHGSIDIFRSVRGLDSWSECRKRAILIHTATGRACWLLCDSDMLSCQLALDERDQKLDRIRTLRELVNTRKENP